MHGFLLSLFAFIVLVVHSAVSWQPVSPPPENYPPVLSTAQMEALFQEAHVPSEYDIPMLRIAKCESGYRWAVLGDNGAAYGLFQLHEVWFRYFGVADEKRLDPLTNVETTLKVASYEVARGYAPFSPWTCQ